MEEFDVNSKDEMEKLKMTITQTVKSFVDNNPNIQKLSEEQVDILSNQVVNEFQKWAANNVKSQGSDQNNIIDNASNLDADHNSALVVPSQKSPIKNDSNSNKHQSSYPNNTQSSKINVKPSNILQFEKTSGIFSSTTDQEFIINSIWDIIKNGQKLSSDKNIWEVGYSQISNNLTINKYINIWICEANLAKSVFDSIMSTNDERVSQMKNMEYHSDMIDCLILQYGK